ncbi:hypothetical protein FT663_03972 [Candidozyma haemuli var. vulneris]|uniref:Uncharacterized protein n=1 Tax=Candidozyma haemuli TaxID=45357 RepID=A0A2V1ASQ6_9ASCO|nr:hypothetical protein CXQ85_004368 [[Candida] haemuloni]KAF3988559.1 hypothetical protein FT663_03972 [[Candida] haemuloni var. vulneris]KAF3990472.1 hypothetical protein FT662_02269 [[Candida] haemuloni var. vulneris]PVH20858.1 hypothetical protein CXQ85_004368 [[Candida] haemuloni]
MLSYRLGLSPIRSLHYTARILNSPFLYPSSFSDLSSKIDQHLKKAPTEKTVLDALTACRDFQSNVHEGDKFGKDPVNKQLSSEIKKILSDENVTFDHDLLRKALLLKLPSNWATKVISTFYERNPKAVIDKTTALIPFRQSLLDGDLKNALKITDITTGHPNYIAQKDTEMRHGIYKLAATAIGITFFSKYGVNQIIEWGWLSSTWKHLGSINAMILTYLLNSSFFVTIVRFGRQKSAAGGDYLTWQKGTFYTHWYKHADEMNMCAKVMQADVWLNGGLENTPSLIEELCRRDDSLDTGRNPVAKLNRDGKKVRLLEPKDNMEDLKMQAYWMSGGDGFEWVEPDQDPADIIWREHLKKLHAPELNGSNQKSLKWAEELIEPPQQV